MFVEESGGPKKECTKGGAEEGVENAEDCVEDEGGGRSSLMEKEMRGGGELKALQKNLTGKIVERDAGGEDQAMPKPGQTMASGRRRTRRSVTIRMMRRQVKKSHLKVGKVMPKV